ncbi:MAG TPA: hypothetical protein VFN92_10660 [Solirubrobacterales bacterium]|nr:hypothetical protein [Solirubrobacterales bacterium]
MDPLKVIERSHKILADHGDKGEIKSLEAFYRAARPLKNGLNVSGLCAAEIELNNRIMSRHIDHGMGAAHYNLSASQRLDAFTLVLKAVDKGVEADGSLKRDKPCYPLSYIEPRNSRQAVL